MVEPQPDRDKGDTVGRKVYETTDYAAMMRRMVSAYGRRVGDADPEDLAAMLELKAHLDAAIQDAVTLQRSTHGRSWADIAKGAGTSRQAAQMRWGKLEESSKSQPPASVA